MKLASYRDGSRDGQLIVVSRDLSRAHFATAIASRLQQVLDDWNFLSPQLEDLSATLNDDKARHAFAFDPRLVMAPLPRAPQCVGLVQREPQAAERDRPLLARRACDGALGAHDDVPAADVSITCHAELAALCADVARGADADTALDAVRLLALAQHWTLPGHEDLAAEHAIAYSPVAVTADELGAAWRGGRVHLQLQTRVDTWTPTRTATAPAMRWRLGELIGALAAMRPIGAGAIVGCALVADDAEPSTHAAGERVRVELTTSEGVSLFGVIDQTVAAAQ